MDEGGEVVFHFGVDFLFGFLGQFEGEGGGFSFGVFGGVDDDVVEEVGGFVGDEGVILVE